MGERFRREDLNFDIKTLEHFFTCNLENIAVYSYGIILPALCTIDSLAHDAYTNLYTDFQCPSASLLPEMTNNHHTSFLKRIISEDRELRRNETVQRFVSRPVLLIVIHTFIRASVDKFALIRIRMKRSSQPFIHKRAIEVRVGG